MKILVLVPDMAKANGIASFFINYLNKHEAIVSMDFYLLDDIVDSEYKKIIENQGEIFIASKHNKISKIFVISRDIERIIQSKNYDYVHINLVNLYAFACIYGLKKSKFNNIIFHAHNPREKGNLGNFGDYINNYCKKNSNKLIACSSFAGNSVFGDSKYLIVHNAIDCQKYLFDKNFRDDFKSKYNLQDKIIVGFVGRLEYQKNPFFIIEIMKKLVLINSNYYCIIVGNGSLEEKLKEVVSSYNLENNILFLGSRTDVNKLYSVFDLFILPSKYEGLGIVLIEAQVSNLPIIVSVNVPNEVAIANNVVILPIDNCQLWVDRITNIKLYERNDANLILLSNKKYNIDNNTELSDFYKMLMEEIVHENNWNNHNN